MSSLEYLYAIPLLSASIVFVFGLIIGSFLNVVILRLHTGRAPTGRSHCMSCGVHLSTFELIPAFSYLALRGRCAHCSSRISSQYILVEVLTGILFMFAWTNFSSDITLLFLHIAALCALVVIFVYDIRHTIIPVEATLLLGASALGIVGYHYFALHDIGVFEHVLSAVSAFAFFGFFWLVSRGRWMGLGDAELAAPLALIVGVNGTISMLMIAFWGGTLYVIIVALLQRILRALSVRISGRKLYTLKSEIPFAPFIIIGFLVVLFGHVDMLAIIQTYADACTRAIL